LLHAVFGVERREDGLVIPCEKEFQSSRRGEISDQVQIAGAVCIQPIQERSRKVESKWEEALIKGLSEKGLIHIPKVLLEDVSEVALGLVGMEPEGE